MYIAARNTGKDGQVIFRSTEDYSHFVALLKRLAKNSEYISICGFSLLKGSFRILFHEKQRGASAKFMQRLGIAYSIYFNSRYGKTGKVFEGPYKDRLLETDDAVIKALCEFHRLPGLEEQDIERYQWSSYRYYLTGRGTWLDKNFVEQYFGTHLYEKDLRHMTSTISPKEAW